MSRLGALWAPLPAPDRRARVVVLAAVVVAALARIGWALAATRTPLGENDPVTYLGLAERFADGDGYVGPTGEPTAYFPPGYPMALGLVFRAASVVGVDDHHVGLAVAFNVVLGTATVALLALLARRLFGWRTAAVTAVVLAVLPSLVGFTSLVLSETLFLFLMAAGLLCLLWERLDAPGPALVRTVAGGLLIGASLLVRPVGALLVVAVVVGFVVARRDRVALVRSGLVVLAVAVVLVPWVVRNAVVMDAGLTLSTNTGDNLCIGNNPSANGTFQVPDFCFADLPDQDAAADVAEVARAEATQERALEWIKGNLGAQPGLVLDRTIATFEYGHYFRFASQSYGADDWLSDTAVGRLDLLGDVGWWAVIALGLCGVPALWGRRDPRRLVVLGSILGMAVVTWPFFGTPRFGLPAVVLLVLPAAVVLVGLPTTWRRVRSTTTGVPAPGAPTPEPAPDEAGPDEVQRAAASS